MRIHRLVPIAGLVAGTFVLAAAQPAGAGAVLSSSGSTVTVALTGSESISFRCATNLVRVDTETTTYTPSPTVTCSSLTQVTVTGDSGSQDVDGTGLDGAAFASKPKLIVALGAGVDSATETRNADDLDLGSSSDDVYLRRGLVANTSIEMGTGALDRATLVGSDANDTLSASSTGANTTLAQAVSGAPAFTWVVKNVEYIDIDGGKGNDTLGATGMTIGSDIELVDLDGEDGNDVLSAGSRPSRLDGGSGTNTFNAGANVDQIDTMSETDVINGMNDGVDDVVRDEESLRFGGRTITGFAASDGAGTDTFSADSLDNDVVVRVRPATNGAARMTFSLNRMGQQVIPAGFELLDVSLYGMSTLTPRTIADVVVPAHDIEVSTTEGDGELIDITVPSGTWTTTVASGKRTITTNTVAAGNVVLFDGATYKVHGPWTNQNQGFGHRIYRDLLLRFATDVERDAVRDKLNLATATRTSVVAGIVNTDEYRGLDVDRVFLRYLRRGTDPSGRTYWINAIENGRSLRQFRAQLFGSNEYFTKAGGTNAGFVTRAYEDVLGRKPDPSGQTYWTNKANNGVERGIIARQFLSSAEAKRTLVRDQFLRFLDRQPTDAEIATWTGTLDSSANGEQALVSFLARSNDYYLRT